MLFEISVVDQNNEKLFEYKKGDQSLLFNKLAAYDDFVDSKIVVQRDTYVIAKSSVITSDYHGGPYWYFSGMDEFIDGNPLIEGLTASKFETGDIISFDTKENKFNGFPNRPFENLLIEEFKFFRSGIALDNNKEKWKSPQGLNKPAYKSIEDESNAGSLPSVLRFG